MKNESKINTKYKQMMARKTKQRREGDTYIVYWRKRRLSSVTSDDKRASEREDKVQGRDKEDKIQGKRK